MENYSNIERRYFERAFERVRDGIPLDNELEKELLEVARSDNYSLEIKQDVYECLRQHYQLELDPLEERLEEREELSFEDSAELERIERNVDLLPVQESKDIRRSIGILRNIEYALKLDNYKKNLRGRFYEIEEKLNDLDLSDEERQRLRRERGKVNRELYLVSR